MHPTCVPFPLPRRDPAPWRGYATAPAVVVARDCSAAMPGRWRRGVGDGYERPPWRRTRPRADGAARTRLQRSARSAVTGRRGKGESVAATAGIVASPVTPAAAGRGSIIVSVPSATALTSTGRR
ncbi:hypothetical protein BU14_2271s0001 [Porphyra umbilicalis]|uniref:Uncharacterized protein n=1 Tax=Porphyra umbilicalis TaxID=2786 RepID=A0A1X6NJI7_PORUM|nr:hypothetical protein BU14_2271s0001 [Porphyra umbilicalis]|eukprot:OSX68767.1 hypothetical protein BU14_2271s0001 [Porphyra umbilicalis]